LPFRKFIRFWAARACAAAAVALVGLAMSEEEVPPAVREALLHVFTMLDRSGTTQIDQREVGFLMNKLLNRNLDEMAISEIMSEICDSDAPGVGIDFDSFLKALGPVISKSSEDELDRKAFAAMDADNSGCISAPELAPLMSQVAGHKMPDSQVKQVLELAAGVCSPARTAALLLTNC